MSLALSKRVSQERYRLSTLVEKLAQGQQAARLLLRVRENDKEGFELEVIKVMEE
ncbi:hypothetical protein MYX78_02405 [Acidobacteria bacterium AH-259-G07]|nr:hypothetical protein [Acidobacteria bacterium AH-259-G07]